MPLRPDQVERLKAKFPGLLIGDNCSVIDSHFGRDVVLADSVDIYMSSVDNYSYVSSRSYVCWADVGKFCAIGPNSFIGMAGHPAHTFVSIHPIFYLKLPERNLKWSDGNYFDGAARTTVGNDVWIGGNVSIRAGVSIGDGAIIGAGAVVTRDVPPYAVMAGVPARKLRDRFTSEQIAFLQDMKWWERDDQWLKEHVKDFHDIEAFMLKFRTPPKSGRETEPEGV